MISSNLSAPWCQTVEQLLAGTELLQQDQVGGRDEGGVQLHQVGMMKPPQQLVLPQHQQPLLRLVRADFSGKHLAGLRVPAQGDHTETSPEKQIQKNQSLETEMQYSKIKWSFVLN